MLFSKGNPVRCFRVSVSPGHQDRLVAFGPGAVVSGSVSLTLDHAVSAYNIRVVFECVERDMHSKASNSVFSVSNYVWGKARSENELQELQQGSHMHLFAIKLPNVNYPPSVLDSTIGYRTEYRVQGYLELCERTVPSPHAEVMYLPLIPCEGFESKRTEEFKRGSNALQVTAQLVKAAYCPGDTCSVRLTIHNRSEFKISAVHIALVAVASNLSVETLESRQSGSPILPSCGKSKTLTLYTETIFVSIPKNSTDNHTVCHFTIPPKCLPSTRLSVSKHLEINHQVLISIPWGPVGWRLSSASAAMPTIALPVTIATVPATCRRVVPQLQLPLPTFHSESSQLPTFIPSVESPDPAPGSPISPKGSYYAASSSSSSPPSPISEFPEDRRESYQDATGHLAVPGQSRRKMSTSSISSTSSTEIACA